MSKKNPVAGKATATVTITAEAITALIAAGVDLNEYFGGVVEVPTTKAPKKASKGKMPKKVKAARVACYDKRIARRMDPTRKGGAGMTKAEKRDLAAELRAAGKDPSDTRTWNKACAAKRGI